MRIGVDTGGTFTDFVLLRSGGVRAWKVPSTPEDPSRAVAEGLQEGGIGPSRRDVVLHGTTVATNALLEDRLARTLFVTNRGLEDVLEIGRQTRPDLFALDVEKPPAVVPRHLRLGVGERQDSAGRTLRRAGREELAALLARARRLRPEAIAVGLLHAHRDGRAERRIGRALAGLGKPISLSSEIAPEEGEFERFVTCAVNAGLVPLLSTYFRRMKRRLRELRWLLFLSNGGVADLPTAARFPVRLVLSGPAGGALAAERLARTLGLPRAAALDMGGTSTDVSLIEGHVARRSEVEVAGRPLRVPSLDVRTVGAGGGSIAWVDAAGLLRVGPRSAGADPGPACYGRGDEPTVTDAHLVLGRLPARLAGGRELDVGRAQRALSALGRRLGVPARRAAEGVLAVLDHTLARAVRSLAVERGLDPGDLPLICFGGAAPLHAARVAALLGARRVFVPPWPGTFSALGLALADPERDRRRTLRVVDPDRRFAAVRDAFHELEREALAELDADGLLPPRRDRVRVERVVECRYVGQSAAIALAVRPGRGATPLRARFDRLHREVFGHSFPEREIEAVTVRVRVRVPGRRSWPRPPLAAGRGASPAAERTIVLEGRRTRVPVLRRASLKVDGRIAGPALLLEDGATTFVEPGWSARVHPTGALEFLAHARRRTAPGL